MPWWSKKIYWKEGKKIEAEISTQAQGPGGWIQLWRLLGRQLLRCPWQLRLRWRLWWSSSNEDNIMLTMIHSLSQLLCFNWDADGFSSDVWTNDYFWVQASQFGTRSIPKGPGLFPTCFFPNSTTCFFWHNVLMIMIVMMIRWMMMAMIDDDMLHLSSPRMAPRVSFGTVCHSSPHLCPTRPLDTSFGQK